MISCTAHNMALVLKDLMIPISLNHDHITKLLDTGVSADMILFDFSKAFDKVCHKWLAIKLCVVRLKEKSLLWILDLPYMHSQWVQLFDDSGSCILSLSKHVLSGVSQWSALGPTLFNIFINDASFTISSKLMPYADNLKLIGPALSCEDHALLQNNLGLLDQWAEAWLLRFNVDKCHVIHFGKMNHCCSIFSQVSHFPL